MTPGVFNLNLYRGDTYRWQFKLWTDAEKTDPADLADVTVKAEIRDKPGGAKITPLECTVTEPNIVDAVLSSEACQLLDAKGSWDLQLTYDASGDVATVLAGAVTVTADVTDSTAVVTLMTTQRMVKTK